MVVTLVVAAEANVKLPKVRSRDELKQALNKLGALRSDQVRVDGFVYVHAVAQCTDLACSRPWTIV